MQLAQQQPSPAATTSSWACEPTGFAPVSGSNEPQISFCAAGATRAGIGLERFMAKLRSDQAQAGTGVVANRSMYVIGNSVSRWLKFLVPRIIKQVLSQRYPKVAFTLMNGGHTSSAFTAGGHGPEYVKHCADLSQLEKIDLIILHYDFMAEAATLIEALQRMPQAPLILVVKHCASMQVESLLLGEEKASAHESAWLARVKVRLTESNTSLRRRCRGC